MMMMVVVALIDVEQRMETLLRLLPVAPGCARQLQPTAGANDDEMTAMLQQKVAVSDSSSRRLPRIVELHEQSQLWWS